MPTAGNSSSVLKAALWMLGAIGSFSVMAISGREINAAHDTFEIMMYRSAVGVVTVILIAGLTGTWHQINTRNFGTHLMRNCAHFTGQNLWFFALNLIPLAQLFALEFTSPLWVILLSPLVLGERITLVRSIAALLGFIGILIIARPDADGISFGMITAATSAIFFALTMILTKKLTRTQSITCIMFYLTVIQLVLGIMTAGYDGQIALPSRQTLPWLFLIGFCGLGAHFCITKALSIAPATVVVPMDFARLPFIAIIGMLLYNEALDIWIIVGALVIFAGNYLNIWSETAKKGATKSYDIR